MIKNIIFDLGGVLLNIDYNLTVQAFKDLGVKDFDNIFTQFNVSHQAQEYEMGLITDAEFRTYIREHSGLSIPDEQIDTAWNAMLLDLPISRINMLVDLKKDYRLFLLSNTNNIHYTAYHNVINERIRPYDFDALFDKPYYSFKVGMRKPNPDIYELVITENNLNLEETIFIDDSSVNIETARDVGMQAYDFPQNEEISLIIKDILSQ